MAVLSWLAACLAMRMYFDPSQLEMLRTAGRQEALDGAEDGRTSSHDIDEELISRALEEGDSVGGDKEDEKQEETETQNETDTESDKEGEKQEETETQNETDTEMSSLGAGRRRNAFKTPEYWQISLRGGRYGKYCADEGHRIICNRDSIGEWEKFQVYDLGGWEFALKGGKDGKWCADERNGGVKCNRDAIGDWETFTYRLFGTERLRWSAWSEGVAFRGGKAGDLCADEGDTVKCNRNEVGAWEIFKAEW